jgi:hypothetical protein
MKEINIINARFAAEVEAAWEAYEKSDRRDDRALADGISTALLERQDRLLSHGLIPYPTSSCRPRPYQPPSRAGANSDTVQAAVTDVPAVPGSIRRAVEELTAQGLIVVLPATGASIPQRPADS